MTSDGTSAWAFHVRQYPVGKHRTRTYRGKPGYKTFIKPSRKTLQRQRDKLRDIIQHHRGAPQAGLVYALNPVIQGWANYYQYGVAKRDFQILDNTLYHQLTRWARYRHPRKSGKWCYHRYWRKVNGRVRFSDGENVLSFYQTTAVSRFVKVQGDTSPGVYPERGSGVAAGACPECSEGWVTAPPTMTWAAHWLHLFPGIDDIVAMYELHLRDA